MKRLAESIVKHIKGSTRGEVLLPGDDGYERARRVWNGMIDRRPAIIIRCEGASDVMKAVRSHGGTSWSSRSGDGATMSPGTRSTTMA